MERSNVVLVGVAGVGKTTLGNAAAQRLGMPFLDGDTEFETCEGAEIDTLLARYGDREFDQRLLACCVAEISRRQRTIVAAPARVTQYKSFWKAVQANAVSIHLRGKPREVYLRQEVCVAGQKLTNDEKLEEFRRREFNDYYWWRLRHCQKADLTIRVVGNLEKDLETLCRVITER